MRVHVPAARWKISAVQWQIKSVYIVDVVATLIFNLMHGTISCLEDGRKQKGFSASKLDSCRLCILLGRADTEHSPLPNGYN